MTTTPRIATLSRTYRIASTAALSADSFSPRPIHRAAAIAPASVTRTSSIAMLRSGACLALTALQPVRCLDSDELQAAPDHRLRRAAEAEAERLLLALEDAMLVVEAVEVVRKADRVRRDALRSAAVGRLPRDRRELGEPFHEVAFLGRQGLCEHYVVPRRSGVAEDSGDARVRVLHVVHRVLRRALGGEVDVDLDRLVGPAVHEEPAGGIDADLVEEVVEEDDVTAATRHARLLSALGQVHELVEQHLDASGVVPEHARDRRVPLPRAVMVGAEDVDRAIEPAVELVDEIWHVRCAIRRAAVLGAEQHAVLVVPVDGRASPQGTVLLVRVEPRQELRQPLLEDALLLPRV